MVAPDDSGRAAGSVDYDGRPLAEPRYAPAYEEPGPYPGLPDGPYDEAAPQADAPSRALGQPAPRPSARWTPGGVREESGPKTAAPGPAWQPPLSGDIQSEPEPRAAGSDSLWQPPEWLTPQQQQQQQQQQPARTPEAEMPGWAPPPVSQQPGWASPPAAAAAPAWAPPAQAGPAPAWSPSEPQAAARAAPTPTSQRQHPDPEFPQLAEDEFVDGGFGDEFDDGDFDDEPADPDLPEIDTAAQSGRHRKRRQKPKQPGPAEADPVVAEPARPKATPPKDDDDDDFDDDDDDFDDDFDDDDFDDDDSLSDMSASDLSTSTGALPVGPKPRKLPWVPIGAVAGGLVLVLAFAFRDTLLGTSDVEEADGADTEGEVVAPEPEPQPEVEPEVKPEVKPEPAPPAIDPAELEEKIAEATSLVNRQKYDDARVIIDEILAKIPGEGRTLSLLAQTQLENNKLEEALATANSCVDADPKQSFCWITVATVEQNNDNLPRALEAYRKYLEVEPDGQHAKSAKKQVARLESKIEG